MCEEVVKDGGELARLADFLRCDPESTWLRGSFLQVLCVFDDDVADPATGVVLSLECEAKLGDGFLWALQIDGDEAYVLQV